MKTLPKHRYDLLKLYDRFLKETKSGRRLQKNGKRIRESSLEPYVWLRKLLADFSLIKEFPLYAFPVKKLRKKELSAVKKYWQQFYLQFTDYLYDDCKCYDNYVGSNIKRIRAFFNYLNEELELDIGNFHKRFYVRSEDIDIITLQPEQLNFLIYDQAFEERLPAHLKTTKDLFVFGCTVALRVSDIFKLSTHNFEYLNGKTHLIVRSQKTNTPTRVLLPQYAVNIIQKYPGKGKTIFPDISNARLNLNIKSLLALTGWVNERPKTRQRRGIPVAVYKNEETREAFRFCDLMTSHTMRRTAITTMLCLGMPENLVRKISGHAAGSKEFYRYVQLSQHFMDDETQKLHERLAAKKYEVVFN